MTKELVILASEETANKFKEICKDMEMTKEEIFSIMVDMLDEFIEIGGISKENLSKCLAQVWGYYNNHSCKEKLLELIEELD